MTTRLVLPAAVLAVALAFPARAEDDALTGQLRVVAEEQIRAYDAEDVQGVLRTMHTRSPEYDRTEKALPEQFKALDLDVKLVDFTYMGHDDEFAVARVKTAYDGPESSGFQDNVTDSVLLFHKEGGVWKLWSDDILGVQLGATK
jgi:hypothetical protein